MLFMPISIKARLSIFLRIFSPVNSQILHDIVGKLEIIVREQHKNYTEYLV